MTCVNLAYEPKSQAIQDMLLRCHGQPELGVIILSPRCKRACVQHLGMSCHLFVSGLLEVQSSVNVLRVNLVHMLHALLCAHMSERMPVAVLSCTMAERAHYWSQYKKCIAILPHGMSWVIHDK